MPHLLPVGLLLGCDEALVLPAVTELEKQAADHDDQQADEEDSRHGAPDDHPSLVNRTWSKEDIIDQSHNTQLNVSHVELTERV